MVQQWKSLHKSNVKWCHLQSGTAFATTPQFVYSFPLSMNPPPIQNVLVLPNELSIKERLCTVLRIFCHTLQWYTVTVYSIICVIDTTVHLNVSIFNFLLFILVQHFPFMCRNFTICMPYMMELWIFYAPLNLQHGRKECLNCTSCKVLTL
jgi:hypothetical protein